MITSKKAKQYNKYSFIQQDLIDWGSQFISPSKGDAVEFGSGTGLFTKKLLNLQHNTLIASDISSYMLDEGKKKFPKIQWKQIDAWNPQSLKADAIYSSSLLQWTPSPYSTLTSWKNSLNQQGSIHALFYIKDTLQELYSIEPAISPITWYSLADWESSFYKVGLKIIDSKNLSKKYLFKNAINLFKFLNIVGTTNCMPLTKKNIKDMIISYEKLFKQQNKVYSTWHFCYIHAQKF